MAGFLSLAIGLGLAAAAILAWPFLRSRQAAAMRPAYLVHFEEKRAALLAERGAERLTPEEAHEAETELKRQLLSAGRREAGRQQLEAAGPAYLFAALLPLAALVIAAIVYLANGRPDLPDAPYAERQAERDAAGLPGPEEAALIKALAAEMARDPSDPKGWELLGAAYVRSARYSEAANAFRTALRVGGPTAERHGGLGEALVLAANGEIGLEALHAFEAALLLDAEDPRARYFIALERAQAGDLDAAIAAWDRLLAETPSDAPWRAQVERDLNRARAANAAPVAPALDPDAAAMIAALPEAERNARIGEMVEGLARRLESAPADGEGWLRLMRSLMVLGRRGEAEAAYGRALAAFPEDAAMRERLTAEAERLGLAAVGP